MSSSPFGQYLREARTKSGKSLREVAEALSITHVYLGEVERGRRRILPEKYWNDLERVVSGVTREGLEKAASASAPIDPVEVEGPGRDVVIALARALEEDGISTEVAERLLRVFEDSRRKE